MKKGLIITLMLFVVMITGACGKSESKLTLEQVITTYEEKTGLEIDREDKPFFSMIGAKDGVIFYMDGDKVALYEFESSKALEDSVKESEFTDWPSNGNILLESSNQEAISIFESLSN